MALKGHSAACPDCGAGIESLRGGAGDLLELAVAHDALCDAGRHLFGEWLVLRDEVAELLARRSKPWGIPSAHEDLAAAEECAAALTSLPGPAAQAIYFEPDPLRREALIRAVVAAHGAGGVRAPEREPTRDVPCAYEGCKTGPYGTRGSFAPRADMPRRRYCCDRCRKADRTGRPTLVETE